VYFCVELTRTSSLRSCGVRLLILVQFEAKVIPDYAALQIAPRDGEGHFVLAGLEE
jgi:hypothetical protein